MAFSAEALLAHRFPEIRQRYEASDAILYALGVGLGQDPLSEPDLACLYEQDLRVLPTFAVTLASPGMWVKEPALGIDWVRLVHAAQAARFPTPLPPAAEVVGTARIASVVDRGEGRGAEAVVERIIADAATGTVYCVLQQTLLMRGNGGFAPSPAPRPPRPEVPARAPDASLSYATSPRAALIYRLSGDRNPLHIDPAVARKAGFERPILHGLASYGIAGWAVAKALAGGDAGRLAGLSLRFASPVLPGDRLDFSFWQEEARVQFVARVGDRVVLDQGEAVLA